jgi:hypothetical protein
MLFPLFGLLMVGNGLLRLPKELSSLIIACQTRPTHFWYELGAYLGYWLFAFFLLSVPWILSLGR